MADRFYFRMHFCAVLFAVFAVGCASDDVAIRLDAPTETATTDSPESTTSSSTSTSPPTTTTSTTTVVSAVAPDLSELTWADEGTVEADVERAFWAAHLAGKDLYTEGVLDPDYAPLLATYTGRDLTRIQEQVVQTRSRGRFFRYPEESETQIELIVMVTTEEALVEVCELNRGELYDATGLIDDVDIDSNFQARFVLLDGEWLREETIKLRFEELEEGGVPECWTDSSA